MEYQEYQGILKTVETVDTSQQRIFETSETIPPLVIGHILWKLVMKVALTETDMYMVQSLPPEMVDEEDWLLVLAGSENPSEALEDLAREELWIKLGYGVSKDMVKED